MLTIIVLLSAASTDFVPNMNGQYFVQNGNSTDSAESPGHTGKYSTNFSTYPVLGRPDNKVRFLESRSETISTLYSQIWWTMGPVAKFDAALVSEYDGKTMAIVGYEWDQVITNKDGSETPVPVTWSYNHHYSARVVGKGAKMYRKPLASKEDPAYRHMGHLSGPYQGMPASVWLARSAEDPSPASDCADSKNGAPNCIPAIVDFDEANGGEWRKSFHGYPHGYAQLVDSPVGFRVEPMQIDTRNRAMMRTAADGFHVDPTLVPKAYAAPLSGPDAVYSGLLECPCTDRISKSVEGGYVLESSGAVNPKASRQIVTYTECFTAAKSIGNWSLLYPRGKFTQAQGSDAKLPAGCSFRIDAATGDQTVFFNHLEKAAACGAGASSTAVAGAQRSLVELHLQLDASAAAGNATITISGPSTAWFGVALGATQMKQQPGAFIVSETGVVEEYKLGEHVAGTKLATQVQVLSNSVANGKRTVVLSRAFKGASAAQYSFNASGNDHSIQFMNAVGSAGKAWPSFHKTMSSSSIVLAQLGVANCLLGSVIKFGSTKGGIIYTHDDNSTERIEVHSGGCGSSSPSDLIPMRNPRCDVSTYVGGLTCCHHKWMLTDREQRSRVPSELLVFHMKIRIWFQEYIKKTPTAPASHQLLSRMYHSIAGEYDVVKQTPSHSRKDVNGSNMQVNVFKFKGRQMVNFGNVRTATMSTPYPTKEQTGIKLLYLGGHCHAPTCVRFDLYNDDTGELLCRQQGRLGKTLQPDVSKFDKEGGRFDEKGYVKLYPCLYGDKGSGLMEAPFISFETNLRSVKVTNATYTHYGEMAHWQCRGVLSAPPPGWVK